MGRLAHSVLTAGGEVTGVEPQFFIDSEVQYDGLTRLIVTQDMTERKTRMIELGDAFIAFPGGTGTLEEIAEVMSKVSLGHLDAPASSTTSTATTPAESFAGPHGRDGAVQPRAAERHLFCKRAGRDKEHPEKGIKKRWKRCKGFQRFLCCLLTWR